MQIANRRKEAFCAIAAIGLALIIWSWRSKILKFFNLFASSDSPNVSDREKLFPKELSKNSTPPPELVEQEREKPRKSSDMAPESLKMSGEKVEKPDGSEPEQKIGNSAPEATE